jgi:cytoplasmic iron level regulating protein YaaA (DUF328/UPF0246 family)
MKILLSPAKALDMTKTLQTDEVSVPFFMDEAQLLMNKLSKLSANKIGELMHLSGDLSKLNFDRNQQWKPSIESDASNACAIAAFNGEVFRGFDAWSLTNEQLEEAQLKVRVLSGLYGLLKPLDLIYPYRLEMGTRWEVTPKKKNLYKFWGSKIADQLNSEETEVIFNLASAEYFKAADSKSLKARIITPSFKDFKNGDYKTIMVFSKRARGAMARYIVERNINDPEEAKGFDIDGYMYNVNLSKGDQWVFTR